MRLLKFDGQGEPKLTGDLLDTIPPYAILSHTWGYDRDEVNFDDLTYGSYKNTAGYAKIQFCGEQAKKDEIEYFWVDACCIDKANHSELSEAIVSMFDWYRNAVKCYVYLSDVTGSRINHHCTQCWWESDFRTSRWFRRGWTLQELLAPTSVEFSSREGELLGSKKTPKVLGEEHPVTISSVSNLALTMKGQGRNIEAVKLMSECVQLRNRVLGAEHPRTLFSSALLTEWQGAE
ncbi:uncharacterized protein PV06_08183 [Exophiala oligosperma]|uniref:Heterokaryon incompatibility domain-containing protein n=1 Tax=Exophiala oligosperma TaxID=215243 RepID=A0A0D2BPW1_9EURO|nr:uncharacterized protein PV06_08183 [Exophiala oligosperma]KIW39582.1 hypothetical protein PV06_08183 [Exophiala oligosperma]